MEPLPARRSRHKASTNLKTTCSGSWPDKLFFVFWSTLLSADVGPQFLLEISFVWWRSCNIPDYVVCLQHYSVCRANACGKLRAWQKKMEVTLLRHSNVIIPSNPARADIRKTMYIKKHVYTYLLVRTCADTCTKTIEAEFGETDCSVTEYVLFEQLLWTYYVKSFFECHSWNTVPEQQ